MITAKQAYKNYLEWKNYSPIEKFVNSVFEYVIKEERIDLRSRYETEAHYSVREMFEKVFLHADRESVIYARWTADFSELPKELYGKRHFEIVSEFEDLYEVAPENSFICKAVKALIYELEVVRGFKVKLEDENRTLTISWDLSST